MINETKTTNPDWLTPEQTCILLGGITTKTLRDWNINHRHRAILAPIRFTHKLVRYERCNVIAFIDKCKSKY
ncbi:DNA-binding protein [Yersinia pseudotuberculosis]|uniref:DNA-binding protein n=1 Tax=Yersinia pseudotuberculosis serotype O:3 (strain YPIII) TaxID=502800 RepID=A0A0H3B0V9_YERPY|nr:hypothetical protein BZ20_3291 [Yersinia pseudotuberculosis]AJJ58446.1 hypothetical protein BZ22_1773 [Yersinia pseudotuberculosis YPIII]AXY33954.1 DNA-binding protein [Yersinia pseudotuberculosis]AYW87241.1 DNA-binding protein [Yersinia pseudotuberculosis]AYX09628.1 DNA-binding protein [Yersinia pseudotuberculosis]